MAQPTTRSSGSVDARPLTWNRAGLLFNVGVTALDVGLAVVLFQVARRAGAGEAAAYLLGGVGPLLGSLAVWLRARSLSGASVAVLAFTVLSAVAVLAGSHRPDVLLYKDAVATGLIGLIFAGSLLCPRPLAFYFGQRYATDGSHDGMLAWRGMWRYRDFRRGNYAVTVVWAAALLLEAAGKALVIHAVGFDAAYVWTQVLPWVATGVALVLTVLVARHYARA